MIYLDNNATTRVFPEALEEMLPRLRDSYGNPSGGYRFGKEARAAVDEARARVAALIDARPDEIVFTSCGTEANNTAIRSAIELQPDRKHIIITAVEHSSIENHSRLLEARGFEVTRLGVDREGLVDLKDLEAALRPAETALVSMVWANNETGVLSPVVEAAALCRDAGVVFHTDAVQAIGKTAVSARESGAHLLSLSGHKIHGPKGVGALYVNRGIRFQPMLIGGGQEGGRRSGTENVAGIVGFGVAAEIVREQLEHGRPEKLRALRDRFENALLERVSGVEANGHRDRRLPNTSNLFFEGVDAEALLILLDEKGICCSPGSACSTGSLEPSRVILAMGYSKTRARSSVRFSFSLLNTMEEAGEAAEAVEAAVNKVREIREASRGRIVARRPGAA